MGFYRQIKSYIEFIIFLLLKLILPKINIQRKSLLLFNSGQIGDLIVSSILLENPFIFNNFSKIHFLVRSQYLDLFADYSGKVKIIGYNYKKYRSSVLVKYKTLVKLRKEGYETCINLAAARGILNEEITHLTGAKNVITLNSFLKYLGNWLGNYFNMKYTTIITKNILNEYDKHIELIKYLSSNKNETIILNNDIVFPNKNLRNQKFNIYKNHIIIAPFSSTMNRDWAMVKFSKLIEELKLHNRILLLGAKNQYKKLLEITENDKNISILAGKLNLNELPQLFRNAKLFIGLDSGLTHIALKMNIPFIAIIGGGEFGRFFPYRESEKVTYLYSKMDCFLCHWECSKKEKYCISEVSVDDVLKEVYRIIQ